MTAPPGLDELRGGLAGTVDRLARIPSLDSHEQGAADPVTGERWDRFQILGHLCESVAFVTSEVGRAVAGAEIIGREPQSSARIEGIETGRLLGEETLRRRLNQALGAAQEMLASLTEADLVRQTELRGHGTRTVGEVVATRLIAHLNDHLDELDRLTAGQQA